MKDQDFHWLRDRVLNIETLVTRCDERGARTEERLEKIEKVLPSFTERLTILWTSGKVTLSVLGGVGTIALGVIAKRYFGL